MELILTNRDIQTSLAFHHTQPVFQTATPTNNTKKNLLQHLSTDLNLHLSFYAFLWLVLAILIAIPLNANAQPNKSLLTQQQQDFLDAYSAIKRNDRKAIANYKKKLKNYPLIIYINYHDYRLHLGATPKEQIKTFIANNKNNYLGDKLYGKWLTYSSPQKILDYLS